MTLRKKRRKKAKHSLSGKSLHEEDQHDRNEYTDAGDHSIRQVKPAGHIQMNIPLSLSNEIRDSGNEDESPTRNSSDNIT